MSIYEDLQTVASEVLTEFKQGVVKLVQTTPGTGPADNPGSPALTEYSLNAVVKGVSFKYVTEGLAVASDLEITVSYSSNFTPTEKDFIEIDGKKYKIVQLMNNPGAGTVVAWVFIVRKGG